MAVLNAGKVVRREVDDEGKESFVVDGF